ncbi:hypothetical protein [Paraburkholderia bannensis]|uniref:hypothetical protein n=1 Tax=Paraburkholderia bannensis TaxID=765414 RepID=UPI001FE2140A|nr:hypothetical protein [Paraburkholderia bannensis]
MSVTDLSMDKNGQPVATKQTQPAPGATAEGHEQLQEFEQLRALMMAKGVRFPADPPAKVREQIRQK